MEVYYDPDDREPHDPKDWIKLNVAIWGTLIGVAILVILLASKLAGFLYTLIF